MKIQCLVEYEVIHLVREAIESKIESLEYFLEKSNDPLRRKFYDSPETIAKQLNDLQDVLRQLS